MTLINLSLERIANAISKLDPLLFKTIHIAGTNGKGSTCSFIELMYLELLPEIKIAKYISPHLKSITERFSINGIEISETRFNDLRSKLDAQGLLVELTEFEQETLIALEYFRQEKVDIAILEVGLGGRLDATNAIDPANRIATAITNISMDHMDYLGDTLEKIRYEKEGIKAAGVPHFNLSVETLAKTDESHPNSINGANFLLALEIFESLNNIKLSEANKKSILAKFPQRYKGRFQYANGIVADGAHNPDGMRVLNAYIKENFKEVKTKILILGFLDKDYKSCLEELFANNLLDPDNDLVILTELDSPRSTPAALLDELIDANKLIIPDPQEAINKAKELKKENDLIIVSGSLSLMKYVN